MEETWRDVNSLYKEVLYNFTESGMHESEFINFCDEKLAAYHLRQYLNLKLRLNEAVHAGLPDHCSIESEKPLPKSIPSSTDKKQTESQRDTNTTWRTYLMQSAASLINCTVMEMGTKTCNKIFTSSYLLKIMMRGRMLSQQ